MSADDYDETRQKVNSTPGAPAPRFEDRYFTVADGLRLHYRDYPGDAGKPPLLCLHGLTRNARDFAELAERYSPDFRVIALDFRGRALSDFDPMPQRYIPPTYAGDVLQLLDQLGMDRAIFIGTSLGGLVTMAVAAMAPNRIAGSVLNDVGPDLNDVGLERIRTYLGKDVRFRSWDEAAHAVARNNHHIPADFSHADWIEAARRICREDNGEIRFDYDMAIVEPFETKGPAPSVDLWPFFSALARKPLLLLRGELSDLLTASAMEKIAAAEPGIRLVTVPGVGHAPMLNEPAAIAALDSFLKAAAA